tara:strand:+ start:697 stop:939 length:243 start_codon:yes stop_codon:yes gene_type:complete
MATPTNPDGEFLDIIPPVSTKVRRDSLQWCQRELLNVHAPLSDIVAKFEEYTHEQLVQIENRIASLCDTIDRIRWEREAQ